MIFVVRVPAAPSGKVNVAINPGVGVVSVVFGAVRQLKWIEFLGATTGSFFAVNIAL